MLTVEQPSVAVTALADATGTDEVQVTVTAAGQEIVGGVLS